MQIGLTLIIFGKSGDAYKEKNYISEDTIVYLLLYFKFLLFTHRQYMILNSSSFLQHLAITLQLSGYNSQGQELPCS